MAGAEPTLGEIGELEFVRRIRARGLLRPEGVVLPIGDDAAAFRVAPGRVAVVTTDLLVEGVHFLLGRSEPGALGAKALAVNLSDLAAMGARPREAFLCLAAPGRLAAGWIEAWLDGFLGEAARHGVNLLGGDTSSSPDGLFVAVTAVGEAEEGRLLRRSAARPGDAVFVTGNLGDSAGGLKLLDAGLAAGADADGKHLIAAHERPRPQLAEGEWLAQWVGVGAAIDVSDGLLADLAHVCAESGGLGATIEAEAVPLGAELRRAAARLGLDPLELALGGGEDYCLLVTARPEEAEGLARGFAERFGRPLHRLGRIEAEPGLVLARAGRREPVEAAGFEHWRS